MTGAFTDYGKQLPSAYPLGIQSNGRGATADLGSGDSRMVSHPAKISLPVFILRFL
jgi:hypothetical protein